MSVFTTAWAKPAHTSVLQFTTVLSKFAQIKIWCNSKVQNDTSLQF